MLSSRKSRNLACLKSNITVVFNPKLIQKCYDSGVFGDDSPLALPRGNWFNVNFYFYRRGKENQQKRSRNSFVFKKDARGVEFIEMSG